MDNNFIKFAIIIICVAIAAAAARNAHDKRDGAFQLAALCLTLAADFFLVLMFAYVPGVLFFCAVQLVYIRRFGGVRALALAGAALILPAAFLILYGDLLITVALIYAQLFLYNFVLMLRALPRFPRPNAVLILLGLSLFVLCDISVAIWNLGRMGVIGNNELVFFANSAIWLFYAPSQVCLALSAMDYARKK